MDARQIPPCPHFGVCGGCQLQDLAYPMQLEGKVARLRGLLSGTGLGLPEIQMHGSPPLGYRNRIRLTLAEVDGRLRAGYRRRAEEGADAGFLPITQCPIAAPLLWLAAEVAVALLHARAASWLRGAHTPDQLELFATGDETRLQMSLYLRGRAKSVPARLAEDFHALCEALREQVQQLSGAGIYLLPPASAESSRRSEIARAGPAWGAPGFLYGVAAPGSEPVRYWAPRGAFFQVNRYLMPELVRLVTAGRAGGLAWDLYAGAGLFARPLAGQFERVTAVEIAEPAASALASTGLANLQAVKATTLDFLRAAVVERERPELIVLDPPRTGAGREICELLGRVGAAEIVFVSCSPETLPADLGKLAAAGYAVSQLHLVDLFPQTTHIETVAILYHTGKRPGNLAAQR